MNTSSIFGLSALAALLNLAPTTVAQGQPVRGISFQQWGFLVFENLDYSDAEANPTFQKIHNYRSNRFLSQDYAVEHPSLPNYLASIAGTTFGVRDDNAPDSQSFLDSPYLTCSRPRASHERYFFAVKHVPALYFQKITTDPERWGNVVDASQFQNDVDGGTSPQWWYYVPNLNNDGHGTSVEFMASYLNRHWVPRFENRTLPMIWQWS